ncbi:response regulator [Nocardioides anomalus]|uniref:Response regulator n=1 Tax=Nocardioides anomalus TaxID=2712223 RepID=A0A6G6W8I3_9ACTN|nr:response regulator [Nocardioides anomalus]QIG41463.1 response regulator [Nocardioides anomalus]
MTPTVLVVEDDDAIREVTALALESVAGWRVLTAPHGSAGLEMARHHTPDAILLDMMMPDLHGLEVFERLQADAATKDIPVVLVTALMNVPGTRPAWEGYPLHGVIAKPYDPLTLCDQIREHVGWS